MKTTWKTSSASIGAGITAFGVGFLLAEDYTANPPPTLTPPAFDYVAPPALAGVFSGYLDGMTMKPNTGIANSAGYWTESGLLAQTNSGAYVQFKSGCLL